MTAYAYRYRQVARALRLALLDDPFYVAMERGIEIAPRDEGMDRYMDYSMVEAEAFGELVLTRDGERGASIWSKPLGPEARADMKRRKRAFLAEHLGPRSLEAYESMCAFMAERAAPIVGEGDWYLSIVGIAPAFQGRGLGPGLIAGVLEATDRLGADTFLETFTPRTEAFYQRLGYAVAGRFREPLTKADYALMIRPARKS